MNNKKNIASAIFLQIITIISGLILPRLIIKSFGSEVNGMISSITQFLSFISLVEGGLGAVVLAELYKPIEQKDKTRIRLILSECQNYFAKLSLIYILYTLGLAIIFPLISKTNYSFLYVSSLVIILSMTTLIRYLFSITYKLYLQADQKIYIVNIVSAIIIVLNLLISFIILITYPEVHLLKIVGDVLFIIQPIIFRRFVEKKYDIKLKIKKRNNEVLKERWSGFSQNLAYFINMNTDIVVITLLIGLGNVSVYTVYMLAINALRTFISLLSSSYQSTLGKLYALNNIENLKKDFLRFERINWMISLICFGTCLLLINHFVKIYTAGVQDVNYYRPMFACIIIIVNLIYCITEPKRYLILSMGKFKEVNYAFIGEAILNILISIILILRFELVGVAIGTLVAVIYRFIYLTVYLRKNSIKIEYNLYVIPIIITILYLVLNISIYNNFLFNINTFIELIIYGAIIMAIEFIVVLLFFGIDKLLNRNVITHIGRKI